MALLSPLRPPRPQAVPWAVLPRTQPRFKHPTARGRRLRRCLFSVENHGSGAGRGQPRLATLQPRIIVPEPTSSGVAGAAASKAAGALRSAIVVMLMTPPRSTREWAVGRVGGRISQHRSDRNRWRGDRRPVFPVAEVGGFGNRACGTRRFDLRLWSAGVGNRALGLQLRREESGCRDR
jgi:hypothetical protein